MKKKKNSMVMSSNKHLIGYSKSNPRGSGPLLGKEPSENSTLFRANVLSCAKLLAAGKDDRQASLSADSALNKGALMIESLAAKPSCPRSQSAEYPVLLRLPARCGLPIL
jgi:hypothetical protein